MNAHPTAPPNSASPGKSEALTTTQRKDPVEVRVEPHHLTVTFDTNGFVDSLQLDNATLFPPDCRGLPKGLCSPAHQRLRSAEGKGKDLLLLDHFDGDSVHFFLFAAVFHGSPECGAYGHWVLRLDPRGIKASEPLVGCFLTPHGKDAPHDSAEPRMDWMTPPVLWLKHEGQTKFEIYTLNEVALTWTRVLAGAARQ